MLFQDTFKTDVQALVQVFDDLRNPFLEDLGQLIELDGFVIMPDEANWILEIYTTSSSAWPVKSPVLACIV